MTEDYKASLENKINKSLYNIETFISKSELCEDKELKSILESIDKLIEETEKTIKDYNIHLTISDNNNSKFNIKEAQNKIHSHKKKYKKLKEKLGKLKDTENNRINDDENSESLSFNSFNKLQLATRSTIEMENISGNILGNLNNQTTQMKGVNSKIGNINVDIDSSNNILNKMFNRQNKDKKMIVIFAVILVFILASFLTYRIVMKFK